ncbi:uncharacterized protein LOC142814250 isoform X2 [Rhipicephalus microplus]|uniref:uncharacterized protein LOC142814250 isoform X2 n=1 Tax=Rhipicephalus microplus TaxID=6941 RepID=UPI003F6D872F
MMCMPDKSHTISVANVWSVVPRHIAWVAIGSVTVVAAKTVSVKALKAYVVVAPMVVIFFQPVFLFAAEHGTVSISVFAETFVSLIIRGQGNCNGQQQQDHLFKATSYLYAVCCVCVNKSSVVQVLQAADFSCSE